MLDPHYLQQIADGAEQNKRGSSPPDFIGG